MLIRLFIACAVVSMLNVTLYAVFPQYLRPAKPKAKPAEVIIHTSPVHRRPYVDMGPMRDPRPFYGTDAQRHVSAPVGK